MPRVDRNFIIDTGLQTDADFRVLFDGEPVEIRPVGTTLADLLVECGIFPSKSQARKNGYLELPTGWTDLTIGKLKNRVCVWWPTLDIDEG